MPDCVHLSQELVGRGLGGTRKDPVEVAEEVEEHSVLVDLNHVKRLLDAPLQLQPCQWYWLKKEQSGEVEVEEEQLTAARETPQKAEEVVPDYVVIDEMVVLFSACLELVEQESTAEEVAPE